MSRKNLDKSHLQTEILTHLRRIGATTLQSIRDKFLISQPSLSRILSSLKMDISPSFKVIARKCKDKITDLKELAALLPK